ncbi:MAG: homocysteine biosynthesis protein [Methanomassiliicoccales archaeon]|nr:MAG: homocysteine biosynthesis protein [Methanomassiliicoccales archaeon]
MGLKRTVEEINARIKKGDAVVMTAEEAIDLVKKDGLEKATEQVDVVTTGTFGAMCSSGAFINFGHSEPPIKMSKVFLNDVPAYGGIAAVDAYIGATEESSNGRHDYGGAHVIEDLIAGRPVKLKATSKGTDCYPRKEIETFITLKTVNQAYLFNPRNMYQNYAVATNSSDRTLFTYMGKLLPNMKNATYSSSGQLSPLLKDPKLRTIGIGTRIFLGGAQGYVSWEGTQYKTNVPMRNGVPSASARTLAVIGDMKQMSTEYIRALYMNRYGISLAVGIGVPIPVIDEDIMRTCALTDEELFAPVVDYALQSRNRRPIQEVSYAELRSGTINVKGKKVKTSSLSSYYKARQIAIELKRQIMEKEFLLTQFVQAMPEERAIRPLDVRSREEVL